MHLCHVNFRIPGKAFVLLFSSLASTSAFSGVHFSLSGSHSTSNTGYQEVEAGALSAGVAFDIGQYIRLGYTHLQQLQAAEGLDCDEGDPASPSNSTDGFLHCPTFESRTHIISNSLDVTLILYAGDVFTPYVKLGAGPKMYRIQSKKGSEPEEADSGSALSGNGEVGMAIKLNQKFSLRFSYAVSQGQKKEPGEPEKVEPTVDGAAQVGIQYSL